MHKLLLSVCAISSIVCEFLCVRFVKLFFFLNSFLYLHLHYLGDVRISRSDSETMHNPPSVPIISGLSLCSFSFTQALPRVRQGKRGKLVGKGWQARHVFLS